MPGQAQVHGAPRIACAGLAPHPRQDGRPSGEQLKICSMRAAEDDPPTGDRHWVTHINKEPCAGLQATELGCAVPIGGPGRGHAPIDRLGCGLGIVARARADRPERRGTNRSKHLGGGARAFAGARMGTVAWVRLCVAASAATAWLVRDGFAPILEWKTATSATASAAHASTIATTQRGRRVDSMPSEPVGWTGGNPSTSVVSSVSATVACTPGSAAWVNPGLRH